MDLHTTSLLRLPQSLLQRLSAHLNLPPPLLATALATTTSLTLFATWLLADYRAWKAFGTGGTPPTPSGYWRMTKIRINRLFQPALQIPSLRSASVLSTNEDLPSYLNDKNLPVRQGPRPKMQARPMPQRQHPEKQALDYDSKSRLFDIPQKFTYSYPQFLELDLSLTEGRSTDAVYALPSPCTPNRPPTAHDKILKNEIAHVHPAENSLHVWLSEADARKVVEKGWGERFILGAMGKCHSGWTFVYAPRNMEEVDVVEEIVGAGVRYVTGEKVR